jgi:hypothetical protein
MNDDLDHELAHVSSSMDLKICMYHVFIQPIFCYCELVLSWFIVYFDRLMCSQYQALIVMTSRMMVFKSLSLIL